MNASSSNKKTIEDLLKKTGRENVDKLINWLASTDFYSAPASSMLNKHGCKEGGLAEHSLNVYKLFSRRAKEFGFELKDDEITIASLCHDLCKVNYYKENLLKNGKSSDTKPYVAEDKFPFGHGEKSALTVQKFINLTEKEALLIRWHMGPYDEAWENYCDKVNNTCPEIHAFHHSDMEASRYVGER